MEMAYIPEFGLQWYNPAFSIFIFFFNVFFSFLMPLIKIVNKKDLSTSIKNKHFLYFSYKKDLGIFNINKRAFSNLHKTTCISINYTPNKSQLSLQYTKRNIVLYREIHQ